jgi:hypothetical protein
MLDNAQVAGVPAPMDSAIANQPEVNADQVTAAEGQADQQEQAQAKTFTQEEVDALIQKRLLKEERRIHRRIESQLRDQITQQQPAPKREAFENDEAYQQALLDKKAEEKAKALLEQRERDKALATRREKFEAQAEELADRYPDFDAVARNPHLTINEAMAEFISESDVGAELAYALGKKPSLAADIAHMSPVQAARALAKLEAEIASKPKAQASKAPDPINPVGNRGRATATAMPSDDDDIDTWMRKERERVRKAYGRR